MGDYREGLVLLPEHMHQSVIDWIEFAEPRPDHMGSFLRAVLSNKLVEAAKYADDKNIDALKQWAMFLYNSAPVGSWGSYEELWCWHAKVHGTEAPR